MPEHTYNQTCLTETRAVLALLRFRSMRDFALHVPLSQMTVIALLCDKGKKISFLSAMRAFQAIHGRYAEMKLGLLASQRRYIAAWAKRWARGAMDKIRRDRNMPFPTQKKSEIRRSKRRRSAIREMQARAFASLEWR